MKYFETLNVEFYSFPEHSWGKGGKSLKTLKKVKRVLMLSNVFSMFMHNVSHGETFRYLDPQ